MSANHAKIANSSSTITIEIRLWCFLFMLSIQEVSIKYYVPSFCPISKCKSMLKKQICGILPLNELFCKIPFVHFIINDQIITYFKMQIHDKELHHQPLDPHFCSLSLCFPLNIEQVTSSQSSLLFTKRDQWNSLGVNCYVRFHLRTSSSSTRSAIELSETAFL